MTDDLDKSSVKEIARAIVSELRALPVQNVPNIRKVHRKYSRMLKDAQPAFILDLAREIIVSSSGYRWVAMGLINCHEAASRCIGEAELEEFGVELNSWGAVDCFAGLLAGPAWRDGRVPDELIHGWAHAQDRWLRRAALVCTVVLNRRSCGGTGDVPRTLAVCRILAGDKDDMVVKALSWALRELIRHDADAVRRFLREYDDVLAARVKREVNNKLTTGVKNPKKRTV